MNTSTSYSGAFSIGAFVGLLVFVAIIIFQPFFGGDNAESEQFWAEREKREQESLELGGENRTELGHGFSDVKSECIDGFRVFVTSASGDPSAIAVVADPECEALDE